jgi:putative endopeptidase
MELQDVVNQQLRALVEESAAAKARPGSTEQKVGDFYASMMDEAAVEAAGLTPLQQDLRDIASLGKDGLSAYFGKAQWDNVPGPVALGFPVDPSDTSRHTVLLSQGGLGLPDRDYYLDENSPRFREVRQKYREHVANMLRLAGLPEAEARAQRVYELEKKIASGHRPLVELRQQEKNYNPSSLDDLQRRAPGMDWRAFFSSSGLQSVPPLVLGQPEAIARAAALVESEPLDSWKDYLTFRLLSRYAQVLPKAFVDESFAFQGRTLSGAPRPQERWLRSLNQTNAALGEPVGKLYVARHFPQESKAKADRLVRNLLAAMDIRLQKLTWMSPDTKAKARVKLASLKPMIGYPDKWRDYSNLQIRRGEAFGNFRRALQFNHRRLLDRLKGPVNRDEWGTSLLTPQMVNAQAIPTLNQIVFPAAALLPPFFDPDADDAGNYGGIGIGIGHEISHHFDDQGRKFDSRGRLADWWSPGEVERFKTLASALVKQYNGYEPLPGFKVNGEQTLGENIADLAGLAIAYDAYKISLNGKPAPIINGLTGDQRFFLSFARVWRAKYRDLALQQQLKTGVHTPGHLRSNTLRNFDPWYDAFNVRSGALYLAPEQRVRIW